MEPMMTTQNIIDTADQAQIMADSYQQWADEETVDPLRRNLLLAFRDMFTKLKNDLLALTT
jgi:hypothetical protein